MTEFTANQANNNNFLVTIAGAGISVDYWARSVTLPSIIMPGADMQHMNKPFALPSNSRARDQLSIEFNADERLRNYRFFRRWAYKGMYGEGDIRECLLDMTVFTLDSNKNPVDPWRYLGAFPSNISSLMLEHGVMEPQPLTFNVGFDYMEEVIDDEGDPWVRGVK